VAIEKEGYMRPNYVAVFVAALAYWLLGAVWYGVLFGKQWMALENITPEQASSMNPVAPYVISFIWLLRLCWRNFARGEMPTRLRGERRWVY
jgi:hypothetical protein